MQETLVLRALGLTEYGARAYQGLVGLGEAKASDVAEAAQIPRTKVYVVLDELIRGGWAEANRHRPRTYRPADPGVRLDQAKHELLDGLEGTKERLGALYHQEGVQFGGPMWVLAGEAAIGRRLERMIREAQREVFISFAFPLPSDAELVPLLAKVAARGTHVRVMVPQNNPELRGRLEALPIEVRTGLLPLRTHFVDDRQALVAFRKPRVDGSLEIRGIWNPHPEMVAQLREVGDQLWMAAGAVGQPGPMD